MFVYHVYAKYFHTGHKSVLRNVIFMYFINGKVGQRLDGFMPSYVDDPRKIS